jgi:hypothetical protein
MWIFTQNSFLSIVKHNEKDNLLIVRSRFRGHIQRLFPTVFVEEDTNKDYRYRAELPAKEVAKAIGEMVLRIKYDNFKGSLDMSDENYVNCCLDVYNSVARNSGDWDFSQFQYLREELNEG